jgi:hypothetical protein
MSIETKDFVLIELLLDNSSLLIYVEADELTPKEWVRAMQTRPDSEIIEGYNSYTAQPFAMTVSKRICRGIRAAYAGEAWIQKYINMNGIVDAEDTTAVQD